MGSTWAYPWKAPVSFSWYRMHCTSNLGWPKDGTGHTSPAWAVLGASLFPDSLQGMIITFTPPHGMRSDYLQRCHCPPLHQPVPLCQAKKVCCRLAKGFWLVGLGRKPSLLLFPPFGTFSPKVRQAPTFLAFRKCLKNWLLICLWPTEEHIATELVSILKPLLCLLNFHFNSSCF